MASLRFLRFQSSRAWRGWPWLRVGVLLLMAAALGLTGRVWATPSLGLSGQILAVGTAEKGVKAFIRIDKNPEGTDTPWHFLTHAHKATDYHVLRLVLSPGGYSGWHSHPGFLIGTVTAGQVDFYDAKCRKRTIVAGDVLTEDDKVHAVINSGSVDAEMYVTFLVKHGAPRRVDETAPPCAIDTPIP